MNIRRLRYRSVSPVSYGDYEEYQKSQVEDHGRTFSNGVMIYIKLTVKPQIINLGGPVP